MNTTWKQKLESVNHLKSEIKTIFKNAKKHHYTHSYILELLKESVYESARYKTLQNYVKSEISGYISANFDIMKDHIEWVFWYDGKFVHAKLPYGKDFDQNLVQSSYVDKGTQNKY